MFGADTRRGWRRAAVAAGVCMILAAAGADAAPIAWTKRGAFEACVEAKLEQWLRVRAEREVNEDPAARQLDDAAVVAWTVDALTACRAQAPRTEGDSEERFVGHMAHWRQHIFDLATAIRKSGQSD